MKKGFTLVEILISISLFSIVMTLLITSFVSFIQYQTIAQKERASLEIADKALANIVRELKYGTDYTCEDIDGNKCVAICLRDQLGRRLTFSYNKHNKIIEKSIDTGKTCADLSAAVKIPLTPNGVTVDELIFSSPYGEGHAISQKEKLGRSIQPIIQVKLKGKASLRNDRTTQFDLRTSVSQRKLETTPQITKTFKVDQGIGSNAFGFEEGEIVSFVYNDDTPSKCQDETGIRYGVGSGITETPCDSKLTIRSLADGNKNLYLLTDNGRIFYIPKSRIDVALASGATYKSTITSINNHIKRVVGVADSGSCRTTYIGNVNQCLNDPARIEKIIARKGTNSQEAYAISRTGGLYTLQANGGEVKAVRVLPGTFNERAFDLDNSNSGIGFLFRLRTPSATGRYKTIAYEPSSLNRKITKNSFENAYKTNWILEGTSTKDFFINSEKLNLVDNVGFSTLLGGTTYAASQNWASSNNKCLTGSLNPTHSIYKIDDEFPTNIKKILKTSTNIFGAITYNNSFYKLLCNPNRSNSITKTSVRGVSNNILQLYDSSNLRQASKKIFVIDDQGNLQFLDGLMNASSTIEKPIFLNAPNFKVLNSTDVNDPSKPRIYFTGSSGSSGGVKLDLYALSQNIGDGYAPVGNPANGKQIERRNAANDSGIKIFKFSGLKIVDKKPTN